MVCSRRKKETFNQNRMKKQVFKKMRRGLGTSRTTLNVPAFESGVPKGEEEEQEIENILEKIMENFPNLAKEIDFQGTQEAQRVPKRLDPRRYTPRHIIITLPKIKDKERIIKAAREKERVTYKGVPVRLSADFSKEILQARRGWKEVFKLMKGKDLHPRLLYPAKVSFRMERQIKCFPDKVKSKEFIITKPLLYIMLKGLI